MIRFSNRLVLDEGFFPVVCTTEVYLTCCCRKPVKICQDQNSLKRLAFNFPDDWDLGSISDFSFTVWDSVNGSNPPVFTASLASGDFISPSSRRLVMNTTKATELSALSASNRYYEVWAVSNSGNKVLLDKGSYQTRQTRKYS